MALVVEPIVRSDFESMATYNTANGGDFVTPLAVLLWTTTDDQAAFQRNRWSLDQQLYLFDNDPSARFMKVIEVKGDESRIICIARWHRYTDSEMAVAHVSFKTVATWTGGPDNSGPNRYLEAYKQILGNREWQGNSLRWVLATIVTREGFRKRGAAELLVRWGIEKAVADDCDAYLEAAAGVKSLYEKCGFRVIGYAEIDLSRFGITRPISLAKMKFTQTELIKNLEKAN